MRRGTIVESHLRLLEKIEDEQKRTRVRKVLQLCMGSLGALARLDAAIFERRRRSADGRGLLEILTEGEERDEEHIESTELLRSLAEIVWGPADALSEVVTALFGPFKKADDDSIDDLDFDAAFAEGPVTDAGSGEGEIDGALDLLSDESDLHRASNEELAEALVPLATQLRHHIERGKERLDEAIDAHRLRQALHDIDEGRREAGEAIFAIIEATFRAHRLHPERVEIVPGFLSDLDQALQIRREVAFLHRVVREQNDVVQSADADVDEKDFAVLAIHDRLDAFVTGDVFRSMRAADRFELLEFDGKLDGSNGKKGKLVCEGLAKYLESLGAVSQREVIMRHDHDAMAAARTHLDGARSLFELSPDGARELIESAFGAAMKLEGRLEPLDELLEEWRDVPNNADEATLREMIELLSAQLPAG